MFSLVVLVVVVDESVVNDVDARREMKSKIPKLITMNLNFDDESTRDSGAALDTRKKNKKRNRHGKVRFVESRFALT